MKVYISGKITGLKRKEVEKNFNEAEKYIKEKYNCEVFNPVKEQLFVDGKTREEYMIKDIEELFKCDSIYLMKNFLRSKGARIEAHIAFETNKKIIFEDVTI